MVDGHLNIPENYLIGRESVSELRQIVAGKYCGRHPSLLALQLVFHNPHSANQGSLTAPQDRHAVSLAEAEYKTAGNIV